MLPLSLRPRMRGRRTAVPNPPPNAATVPQFSISVGFPSGPTKSRSSSPGSSVPRCMVVFPTSWKIMVTVPSFLSAFAIVSGILSPLSVTRNIMNCPGFAARATNGAFITIILEPGPKTLFWSIGYPIFDVPPSQLPFNFLSNSLFLFSTISEATSRRVNTLSVAIL